MDAGWNREDARDAERIQAALRDAGVDRLDVFIASHFHGDHVGRLAALAARVRIGRFIDHGESVEQATERGGVTWRAYLGRGRRPPPHGRLVRPCVYSPTNKNPKIEIASRLSTYRHSASASFRSAAIHTVLRIQIALPLM